jgi:hypothetical protein
MIIVSPASAAENIGCATALITPAVRDHVFTAYRDNKNIGEAVMEQAGTGLIACRTAQGWSEAAMESALRALFGDILSSGILAELAQSGVDRDAMLRTMYAFLGLLSPDDQRKMADGTVSAEVATGLVQRVVDDGVVKAGQIDEKMAGRIGELASACANATVFRRAFARQ